MGGADPAVLVTMGTCAGPTASQAFLGAFGPASSFIKCLLCAWVFSSGQRRLKVLTEPVCSWEGQTVNKNLARGRPHPRGWCQAPWPSDARKRPLPGGQDGTSPLPYHRRVPAPFPAIPGNTCYPIQDVFKSSRPKQATKDQSREGMCDGVPCVSICRSSDRTPSKAQWRRQGGGLSLPPQQVEPRTQPGPVPPGALLTEGLAAEFYLALINLDLNTDSELSHWKTGMTQV